MERTLNRALRLTEDEVVRAITEWLESHDVPIGDNPQYQFSTSNKGLASCVITGTDEASIEFTSNSCAER